MTDEEKVIKGLEEVDAYFHRMTEVCYRGDEATFCDLKEKVADALALLKEQEEQEESVPLKPLCRWLSHYAVCPTKTGKQPPTNIEMVRVGWEHWFRNGFKEWLKMGKPE